MASNTILIESLPQELTFDDAAETVYRDDLDWIEDKLRQGLSVLIECDKQLTLYIYKALRGRLNRRTAENRLRCRLISGHAGTQEESDNPLGGMQNRMQRILSELQTAIFSGESDQIIVLPHLDVLTTTTRSGLNMETREAAALLFENPDVVFLGFKDPSFELPKVIENVFAVRRSLIGIPRDRLPQIILQREARKLGVREINPYTLYKYVSGLNAVRCRQILRHFQSRIDFDPEVPESATEIYREIRQMTLISDFDLPNVDLDTEIGGYQNVKDEIKTEILELLQSKEKSTEPDVIKRIEEIIPKGIIFHGPPGTGKTFFAKAIATALDATIIIVSGPELKSKWVGESLPWDEEVFVIINGRAQHIPIGKLVEEHAQDEVLAWTYQDNGKAHIAPVTGFLTHEGPNYVDVLKTETGRQVRVTGGHSLFVNQNGTLGDVIADDIVAGETRVAVPLRIHAPQNVTEINLIDCFSGREDIHVQGYDDILQKAQEQLPHDLLITVRSGAQLTIAQLLASNPRCAVSLGSLQKALSAHHLDLDLSSLELYCWHRNRTFPTVMPLTEEFGEFLGAWAAEGCYNQHGCVRLSVHQDEVPRYELLLGKLFDSVSVSPKQDSKSVSINIYSTLLLSLMRDALHIPGGASEKRVPSFIFQAPLSVVAAYLRGYFSGDGTFSGKYIEATTVSKGLAHDIATLLQYFGIAARLREKPERTGSTSHRVRFLWSAFLRIFADKIGFADQKRQQMLRDYVDNMTFKRKSQTPEAHMTNDVLWDLVVEKTREPYDRKHVYDLSVSETERFVAGYGNVLVHNSEENLRRVFAQARKSAPSIIVFDELDSFASARGTYTGSGVEHSMVNQMLTEMDGFRKEELVFVVGTTNFMSALDPALLRPGRFELSIHIPYPNAEDRKSIMEIYRDKFKLDIDEDTIDYLVQKTGGYVDENNNARFSGDHIYAIARALKREELRRGTETMKVTEEDVNKAISTRKKSPVKLKDKEERTIAIHEAGHAICAYVLPNCPTIEKITIATGQEDVLGYVMQSVKENKYITTKLELLDDICVLMGGRIAELMLIGDISIGSFDDLQRASEIARMMVEELGMGDALGLRTYGNTQRDVIELGTPRRPISERMAARIDDAIAELLEEQRERTDKTLKKYKKQLDKLVAHLLEHKTCGIDEMKDIFGGKTFK